MGLWLPANPSALPCSSSPPEAAGWATNPIPNPPKIYHAFQALGPFLPVLQSKFCLNRTQGQVVWVHPRKALPASPKYLALGCVTLHPFLMLKSSSPDPNCVSPPAPKELSWGDSQQAALTRPGEAHHRESLDKLECQPCPALG